MTVCGRINSSPEIKSEEKNLFLKYINLFLCTWLLYDCLFIKGSCALQCLCLEISLFCKQNTVSRCTCSAGRGGGGHAEGGTWRLPREPCVCVCVCVCARTPVCLGVCLCFSAVCLAHLSGCCLVGHLIDLQYRNACGANSYYTETAD